MADKLAKDVTYAELAALMAANEGAGALRTGEKLILTFNTVHYITDGLIAHALDEESEPAIATGATEHLILTATSPNTIDKRVQSIEYPNDIIEYDWNPANWEDNINFYVDGAGVTLVAGFKGVITYRKDCLKNNSAGFDFRNCLNRLWSITQTEWSDTPGTYSEGDLIQVTTIEEGQDDTVIIYRAMGATIATDIPGDSALWLEILNISQTPFLSNNSSQVYINSSFSISVLDDTDFDDFLFFNTSNAEVLNISIEQCSIDVENLLDS